MFKREFKNDHEMSLSIAGLLKKNILDPGKMFIDDFSINIRQIYTEMKKDEKLQVSVSTKIEKVFNVLNYR